MLNTLDLNLTSPQLLHWSTKEDGASNSQSVISLPVTLNEQVELEQPSLRSELKNAESISDLADVASSLISFFWLLEDYAPPFKNLQRPRRGLALPTFQTFLHEILATTQLGVNVLIYALVFIDRLRRKVFIRGEPGSEFSVAVVALMLANKVTDDNTYSASTWSTVSSIPLTDLVAAEREFLVGLQHNLHVRFEDYRRWKMVCDSLGEASRELDKMSQTKKQRKRQNSSFRSGSSPVSKSRPIAPLPSRSLCERRFSHSLPATNGYAPPNGYPAMTLQRKRPLSPVSHTGPPSKRSIGNAGQVCASSFPSTYGPVNPSFGHLVRSRETPQVFVPPQINYYQAAAGQRIYGHFQPVHVPVPQPNWLDPRLAARDYRAYSLSPVEMTRNCGQWIYSGTPPASFYYTPPITAPAFVFNGVSASTPSSPLYTSSLHPAPFLHYMSPLSIQHFQ